MIRLGAILLGLSCLPVARAGGPADTAPFPGLPPSLQETAESARNAWENRDLTTFLSPAGGGRILVILPSGRESAPITAGQAKALLSSYLQGTQEVSTVLQAAREVDSTQGYVELHRTYRMVGLPGDREVMILLGYRRGRENWVLTEVRIAS